MRLKRLRNQAPDGARNQYRQPEPVKSAGLSQAEQEDCVREAAKIAADAMVVKYIQSMLAENPKRFQKEEDRREIYTYVNLQRDAKIADSRAVFSAQEEHSAEAEARNIPMVAPLPRAMSSDSQEL
jgi:hypothetical protein